MSTATSKLPLSEAQQIAARLVELLTPGCFRIEVAGSIRRGEPWVGDIELVCIPAFAEDLFGNKGDSRLDLVLESLCLDGGHLRRLKGGEKYKQFEVCEPGCTADPLCKLDLFIVTKESWGCQFLIRTGPSDFSHRLVTWKRQGGLCPRHLYFRQGRLWSQDTALDTPEERSVLAALGLPWIEPAERKAWVK